MKDREIKIRREIITREESEKRYPDYKFSKTKYRNPITGERMTREEHEHYWTIIERGIRKGWWEIARLPSPKPIKDNIN